MKKAVLALEDGSKYEGFSFGANVSVRGEVVFNTGMVGYSESLTDPSYRGQILVATYPLQGNYGVPNEELDAYGISKHFESDRIHAAAYVVSEYSENYSHWTAKKSLGRWLKEEHVPGITGIDTRALTKRLREKGVMLGKIIIDGEDPGKFCDPNQENLVAQVSVKKPVVYGGRTLKTVIAIDCGIKNNSLRNLLRRGLKVIRVPWDYDFFHNGVGKFDGVFISNGPGDPAYIKETHRIVTECFTKKIPTFGICLGNQLMAIATGAKTYKLKYGHRAQNQPCMEKPSGRCVITTQNHGFAIDQKTLGKEWKIWFQNVNDATVEGIRHTKLPFLAVQFHPENMPGPTDTENLFDEFVKML